MTAQQKESVKALALKGQSRGGGEQVTTTWAGIQAVKESWRSQETITVEQAAIVPNISRNSAYAAVHSGQLPGVWIGKRFLVSVPRLKRMIDGEAAA